MVEVSQKHGSVHNYYKKERPEFYTKFLDESKLPEEFLEPGEKFNIDYSLEQLQLKEGQLDWNAVEPIKGKKEALQSALASIKGAAEAQKDRDMGAAWKGFGKAIFKIAGEMPEDVVKHDYKDVDKTASGLLEWLQGATLPPAAKRDAALKLIELKAFDNTGELRARIEHENGLDKALLIHEYYVDSIKLHHLEGVSDRFKEMVILPELNRKVRLIDSAKDTVTAGDTRSGQFSFRLSERKIKTACKGFISEDCLSSGNMFAEGGVGQAIDPAVLNFEIYEDKRWVGNMYTAVVKDEAGRVGLLVDTLQTKISHPFANANPRAAREFATRLYAKMHEWGGKHFQFFVVTAGSASNRAIISDALKKAAAEGKNMTLTKVGGDGAPGHFRLGASYVQSLGRGGRQTREVKEF
jgi:hypothetical protein